MGLDFIDTLEIHRQFGKLLAHEQSPLPSLRAARTSAQPKAGRDTSNDRMARFVYYRVFT